MPDLKPDRTVVSERHGIRVWRLPDGADGASRYEVEGTPTLSRDECPHAFLIEQPDGDLCVYCGTRWTSFRPEPAPTSKPIKGIGAIELHGTYCGRLTDA